MTSLFWLYTGIVLIILELVTPGFVLMFFGISAVLTAFLRWVLPTRFMDAAEWYFFALFSVALILFLRKYVKSVFAGNDDKSSALPDAFVGKNALVTEEITRLKTGKIEFNGTNWKAELSDPDSPPLPAGTPVEITKHENLTVFVKPKQQ